MSRLVDSLFDIFYPNAGEYGEGTPKFHELCHAVIPVGSSILEIGAGPANMTTAELSRIGRVTGADVSEEVRDNPSIDRAVVFDGRKLPFGDNEFDVCFSNYVLEHVADPLVHFREVARVLRPGGIYVLRTPNLLHYIAAGSYLLPHRFHIAMANRLRALPKETHDPWPTVYRANRPPVLKRLAMQSGLRPVRIETVETEPSYARSSALLFFPMMLYERIVNSSELFRAFRSSITAIFQKPEAQ